MQNIRCPHCDFEMVDDGRFGDAVVACSQCGGEFQMPKSSDTEFNWVNCPGCNGEIGIPVDWSEPTAECPKCGSNVAVNGAALQWRPSSPAPAPSRKIEPNIQESQSSETTSIPYHCPGWMKGWGVGLQVLAALAALSSFYYGGEFDTSSGSVEGGIYSAALNPLFWLGFLGYYWEKRYGAGRTGKLQMCPRCHHVNKTSNLGGRHNCKQCGLRFRTAELAKRGTVEVCPKCRKEVVPRRQEKGSLAVGLVLCCFFVLPGLIYFAVMSGYKYICPKCGNTIRRDGVTL